MKCVFKPHSLIGFDGGRVEGTHPDFDLINAPAPRGTLSIPKQRRRDTTPPRVLRNAYDLNFKPMPNWAHKVRFGPDIPQHHVANDLAFAFGD